MSVDVRVVVAAVVAAFSLNNPLTPFVVRCCRRVCAAGGDRVRSASTSDLPVDISKASIRVASKYALDRLPRYLLRLNQQKRDANVDVVSVDDDRYDCSQRVYGCFHCGQWISESLASWSTNGAPGSQVPLALVLKCTRRIMSRARTELRSPQLPPTQTCLGNASRAAWQCLCLSS